MRVGVNTVYNTKPDKPGSVTSTLGLTNNASACQKLVQEKEADIPQSQVWTWQAPGTGVLANHCMVRSDGKWLDISEDGHTSGCNRVNIKNCAAPPSPAPEPPVLCSTDEDCSLLGTCNTSKGTCVCDPGWKGTDCAIADLQPYVSGEGYVNSTAASWGGRPLYAEGKWHLFATQIAQRCPLILFMNNSEVVRAEATNPAGPYTFKQVVLPPFHHNPTAIGPTPDGYYLIFSIGTTNPADWLLQCKGGLPACAAKDRCRSHGTPNTNGQISISWSRSMAGPWRTRVALAPFVEPASAWNCKNNNPSALIREDGRVLLMYHGSSCDKSLKGERLGLAEAVHWNSTFVKRGGGPIIAPENGTGSHEDPFVVSGVAQC
jgi:hypothetical protein